MPSEGELTLKGNASHLDATIKQSTENAKKLGEHAGRAAGHAKTFGQAMEHTNKQLERSLIHGVSLAHVMREVAAAVRETQDESAKAAKNIGDITIKRDQAARRLGLSDTQAKGFFGGEGTTSQEERVKFGGKLSEMKAGRAHRPLTSAEQFKVQSAFNSGLISEDEIRKAVEEDRIDELNVGKAYGGLSEEGKSAYNRNAQHQSVLERVEELNSRGGAGVSAADDAIALRNAKHPALGFLQNAAGKATSVVGGGDIIKSVDRAYNGDDNGKALLSDSASWYGTAVTAPMTGGIGPLIRLLSKQNDIMEKPSPPSTVRPPE